MLVSTVPELLISPSSPASLYVPLRYHHRLHPYTDPLIRPVVSFPSPSFPFSDHLFLAPDPEIHAHPKPPNLSLFVNASFDTGSGGHLTNRRPTLARWRLA
ncbi:hypothetical protein VTJ04DRAFT_7772 [Mycothermus thermophilus]|uniref:uncharacterized protein n=1 Tax=Humicola insolens TaxID=85995 RepID=UPI00374301C9